jgi:hypothetical protein
MYLSQKLTQFSQQNNVLDPTLSDIDALLSRNARISSTQVNGPIWNKWEVLPLENPDTGYIPFKRVTQFSQVTMCYTPQLLTYMLFFPETYVFLQLRRIGLFGTK